jgi:hypothetical protein
MIGTDGLAMLTSSTISNKMGVRQNRHFFGAEIFDLPEKKQMRVIFNVGAHGFQIDFCAGQMNLFLVDISPKVAIFRCRRGTWMAQRTGMVRQSLSPLLDDLSVFDNFRFAAMLRVRDSKLGVEARIDHVLLQLDLLEVKHRREETMPDSSWRYEDACQRGIEVS